VLRTKTTQNLVLTTGASTPPLPLLKEICKTNLRDPYIEFELLCFRTKTTQNFAFDRRREDHEDYDDVPINHHPEQHELHHDHPDHQEHHDVHGEHHESHLHEDHTGHHHGPPQQRHQRRVRLPKTPIQQRLMKWFEERA